MDPFHVCSIPPWRNKSTVQVNALNISWSCWKRARGPQRAREGGREGGREGAGKSRRPTHSFEFSQNILCFPNGLENYMKSASTVQYTRNTALPRSSF